MSWKSGAVSTEGAPLLFATLPAYQQWCGSEATEDGGSHYETLVMEEGFSMPADLVRFGKELIGLIDSEGDVAFDIGVGSNELVIAAYFEDEDDPKQGLKLRKAIEERTHPEYLVGELSVTSDGLVIASAIHSSAAIRGVKRPTKSGPLGADHFFVALPQGVYTAVEGCDDEEDWNAWWVRLEPKGSKQYHSRPEEEEDDPVASVMARMSFEDDKKEARSLESAIELIELGRPDLALEVCSQASPARKYLAAYPRVLALAAAQKEECAAEAAELARTWLSAAETTNSANQVLVRDQILKALDAALAVAKNSDLENLRKATQEACEPDVFVEDGDFF